MAGSKIALGFSLGVISQSRYRQFGTGKWKLENQFPGFQRKIGFRAAAVSSSRETRVECGASSTSCGSSCTSSAIDVIASMNRSISSLDSLSVGSIIIAPGTINGNAVV